MKLYVSPSTQEHNTAPGGYIEEVYCNRIADLMMPRLRTRGFTIFRNLPNMTLSQVIMDSNRLKPDLHFAIHTNAMGTPNTGRGCEVWIHKKGGEAERFANILYSSISALTPWPDRGIKEGCNRFGPGKGLAELSQTNAPAALIEIDFHDNAASAKWLLANMELIAMTSCVAIEDYFGLPRIKDIAKVVARINQKLAASGLTELAQEYWTTHAIDRQTCDGRYVATAFARISEIP